MNDLATCRESHNLPFNFFDNIDLPIILREKNEEIQFSLDIPSNIEHSSKSELGGFVPLLFSENDKYNFSKTISNSILHIFSFRNIPIIAKLYYCHDLTNELLVTAQKRGAIIGEGGRIIESAFASRTYVHKKSELYIQRIDLLESVSLAAKQLMINPPEELLNQKEVWKNSVYQEICNWGDKTSYKGSKIKICTELRRIGKSIDHKENPFSLKEMKTRSIVEYALTICRLLAIESTDRNGIRKDIELKLENFRKAYISLAGYMQRDTETQAKSLLNGKFYMVGINNHYEELSIHRTYTKLPFSK